MSTRIKYSPTRKKNVYKSNRTFYSEKTKGTYRVYLNLEEMTYRVINIKSESSVRSTKIDRRKPPKHLNTLKAQAKKAIKTLGVQFDVEIRNR